MDQELLSATEAARRLKVSRQWVVKLCSNGRVQGAQKVGRQWVIPAGAKIDPPPPRPAARTIEIPRAGARKKPRRAQKP